MAYNESITLLKNYNKEKIFKNNVGGQGFFECD